MNRYLRIILIAIIVLIATVSYSFAATGTITGTGVRVRKEPDTNAEIITNLYKDNKVEVIEKDGNWYKIKVEDKVGYTHQDYITVDGEITTKPQDNTQTTPETKEVITVNSKLKIRTNAKIYILPLIYSTVTNNVAEGKEVLIEKKVNDWSYITVDGVSGWVRNCYIIGEVETQQSQEQTKPETTVEETKPEVPEQKPEVTEQKPETTTETVIKKGYINEISGVNVRQSADKTSNILGTVNMNAEVSIYKEEGDWYKVSVNGINGYVYKPLVSDSKVETTNRSQTTPREDTTVLKETTTTPVANTPVQTTSSNSAKGEQIVTFAKGFLGYKYVYGGTTPSGFDCSGFVYYIFNQSGISLSRSLSVQSKSGTYVEKSNLRPGDVIIFNDWDNLAMGHVGIYIGDNQFIHAANSKRGVVTDYMDYRNSYYNTRYVTARRLV